MNETDRYRQWAAAYALGALIPGEQGEYERHLAICAQCSSAVAELEGLPELLDALTPAEALALGRSRLAAKLPLETRLPVPLLGWSFAQRIAAAAELPPQAAPNPLTIRQSVPLRPDRAKKQAATG